MNSETERLLLAQGSVVAARQLSAQGISSKEQRQLIVSGDLLALRKSIYTTGNLWHLADARTRHRVAVAGALLIRRRVEADRLPLSLVGGHESAEFVWGLSDRAIPPDNIHLVCSERRRRTGRSGVVLRPAALPAAHVTRVESVPFTSLGRTAVDLMRRRSARDAVLLADRTLRAGVSRTELRQIAAFCSSWRGGTQAVEAAEFASPLAESPAESLARWTCHRLGLPTPEPQVQILDARGFVGRVDLLFGDFRTILEVDGRLKYGRPTKGMDDVLWHEKLREDRLRDAGYEVVRTRGANF
jgi:hypothetical protein